MHIEPIACCVSHGIWAHSATFRCASIYCYVLSSSSCMSWDTMW